MKKRLFALLMTGTLIAGSLCGCENKNDVPTITVFNYGMYIDPDILDQFTEETGIRVLYEEAQTPEELYAKYSSGAIRYDAVCSSEYIIMKLMEEGSLQPIDYSKFEHIDNISDEVWSFCATFDEDNQYALPYFWGTVGIVYNKDMVLEPPVSWDVLFNGEYAGNFIMQNSMRDAFMIACKYLGYSCNTTDPDELAAARDLLIAQKPDVMSYLVDEVRDEMIAESAALGVIYSGDGSLAKESNDSLEYIVPSDGSNLWVDCWGITSECINTDAVCQFLDYVVCREDIAMQNFEYVYYPSSNQAVIDALPDEIKNDPTFMPDIDSLDNCEVYQLLDEDTMALMDEMWKQIKAN